MRPNKAVTIEDLRRAAARRLPKAMFDTIEGGAGSEQALRRNLSDLERLSLLPRVLRDVSEVDPGVELVGGHSPLPLVLGPTGMSGFYWPEGELAVAAAAEARGLVYVVSAMSSIELERIARPGRRLWFQLYPLERREVNEDLVRRAQAAGYEALVVTVDAPRIGLRLRDVRNGVQLPPRLGLRLLADLLRRPRWVWPFVFGYRPAIANLRPYDVGLERGLRNVAVPRFDPRMGWADIARLAQLWGGPLIVKGVMHPDDIKAAADAGAAAVVISNHGGRQLDCAPSTAAALRRIDPAAFPLPIYVDGGVRTGSDIARLLALGARACFVGRAYLYGLAAGGEAGVGEAIDILSRELRDTMALSGRRRLEDLGRGDILFDPLPSA